MLVESNNAFDKYHIILDVHFANLIAKKHNKKGEMELNP
jgi:hypothetical protein